MVKKRQKFRGLVVGLIVLAVISRWVLDQAKVRLDVRSGCLLCSFDRQEETNYQGDVAPDGRYTAYFKQEVAYVRQKPLIGLSIGEGIGVKKYYEKEKVVLCTNSLSADNEICFKDLIDRQWPEPKLNYNPGDNWQAAVYWDEKGNLIYGFSILDPLSRTSLQNTYGIFNPATRKDEALGSDRQELTKLQEDYAENRNPTKLLVWEPRYVPPGDVYLVDTEKRSAVIYLRDIKRKEIPGADRVLTYDYFKSQLGDERLK